MLTARMNEVPCPQKTACLFGYTCNWSPPPEMERFMAKAKEDGKLLVYIVSESFSARADPQGFGSIVMPRPNAKTKSIIKPVEKGASAHRGPAYVSVGVRAIIAKG